MSRSRITTLAGFVLTLAVIWFSLYSYRPRLTKHGAPLHRLAHIAAFGMATLFLCAPQTERRSTLSTIAVLLCLAIALEILQFRSENNAFEWGDVVDDIVGILGFPLILKSARIRAFLSGPR